MLYAPSAEHDLTLAKWGITGGFHTDDGRLNFLCEAEFWDVMIPDSLGDTDSDLQYELDKMLWDLDVGHPCNTDDVYCAFDTPSDFLF